MPNRFDEDRRQRIDAAKALISADPDSERLTHFAEVLFAHGAGEDIVRYDAETLAAIARDAFRFFRSRTNPVAVRVADI